MPKLFNKNILSFLEEAASILDLNSLEILTSSKERLLESVVRINENNEISRVSE